MNLLLFALALGLLALFLRQDPERDPAAIGIAEPHFLLLVYLLPAFFFLLALLLAPAEASRFRMALVGLGIRDADDVPWQVSIGGNPAAHTVWVKAFGENRESSIPPLGELVFEPPGYGERAGRIALEVPATASNGLLVRHPRGAPFAPVTATRLAAGDVIEVADASWEVRFEERFFGRDREWLVPEVGDAIEIPLRHGKVPLLGWPIPIRRPFSVNQQTYPLSAILGPSDELRSFLYRRPGHGLWMARLEESVQLLRTGEVVAFESRAELEPGERIHAVGLPRPSDGLKAGGLRDRRSFRVTPGRRSLLLALDTPEIYSLTAEEIRPLTDAIESDVARVHLAMGGWKITDRYLHLRHASDLLAGEAFGSLDLPLSWGAFAFDPRRFGLLSPHGQRQIEEGEPFWLGRRYRAAVQIDLLSPPLVLGLLTLLLALLKAAAAGAARFSREQLLFAAALEMLLAVRVLLGYRVWAMPPFAEEAFRLSLVAWALVPWTFLAASLPPLRSVQRRELGEWLPAAAGCCLTVAWCARLGGGGARTGVWMAVVLLALALPVMRSGMLWTGLADRLHRLRPWPDTERGWIVLWCVLGCLPFLARGGLVLFGFRESMSFGGVRLALSLFHVPLALLLEAGYLVWLWHTLRGRRSLRLGAFLPAPVVVLGTWFLPSLLVSDLGLALLHLPVFVFAMATVTLAVEPQVHRPWALWAPAVAFVLCVLLVSFPVIARVLVIALPDAVHERLSSERNYLRLLAFSDPGQLREIGVKTSEELSLMSAVLRVYTAGEGAFWGRGDFAGQLSPHLKSTALREHVPAIFIAGEWGLVGTLGLIGIYLLAASCGPALMPWRRWYQTAFADTYTHRNLWAALGGLGALTLALPSVYMILANYGVVLFTGRNSYLMGLDSTADLLETLTLVLLFAQGAAALRDEGF